MLGQHAHDDAAVGDAGGLLGVAAQQVFKQLQQHVAGALVKGGTALGTLGHLLAVGVHPAGKGGVLDQLFQRLALKHAEGHLPQILQRNLMHAGIEQVCRLYRPLQRRGEHHRDLRVGVLLFQRQQPGLALVAQRQIGAAADVAALQVAGSQSVTD